MESLLNTTLIVFLSGILFGLLLKIKFNELITKFLGYYLLFSIGLKGGTSLQNTGFTSDVNTVLLLGIFFAFLIPSLSFIYLKNILTLDDAAALSGAYGSVSAVTFVTADAFLVNNNQLFDSYMSAVLVVMEFPAIFMALFLVTHNKKLNLNENLNTIKYAFLEIPNIILISSLLLGYSLNKDLLKSIEFITTDMFYNILIIFLFVMGTRVAIRIGELKGQAKELLFFALLTPLFGAIIALLASISFNISSGNATLLMVLTASASYIAVPAVVKDAIPKANPAIYLGLSLGITFPFNIILGIPLYNELAKYFIG